MLWIYFIAAALIAWGIYRDLARRETWMIGFGKVVKQKQPGTYWLTIGLRALIFAAVLLAAWYRTRL